MSSGGWGELRIKNSELRIHAAGVLVQSAMMPAMKSISRLCVVGWVVTVVLLAVASSQTLAGEATESGLPDGVMVREISEWNRVWVRIGEDVLNVDLGGGVSPFGTDPRFRVSTGASGPAASSGARTGLAVELRPASRRRSEAETERAVVDFESGFNLAAGGDEVVLFDLGRAATSSDAVVWLPRQRVLITGAICNSEGIEVGPGADAAAWMRALERLRDLQPDTVIPGRGAVGGGELIAAQLDRISSVVEYVTDGLMAGTAPDEVVASFSAPWFGEWRSRDRARAEAAVRAVVDETTGLRPPWELIEERGLREGPSPTRDDEGWTRPRAVLWENAWPDRLPLLAHVAPGVEIIATDSIEVAMARVGEVDAVIGTATPELLAAGTEVRWVQVGSAGVERYLRIPQLGSGEVLLTNGQRLASPQIGEHVLALTRALARGLDRALEAQSAGEWRRAEIRSTAPLTSLRGKTMLVVGLGGIGTEVARLASGAGMRVTAIRSSRRSGPPFVDVVGLTGDLLAFAHEADVVANCLPLTPDTEDVFDREVFRAMPSTAFFVNVGRGGTVDTGALIEALEAGEIAGAGLDVTDPEPLPPDHPLWRTRGVIITQHYAGQSDVGSERRWLLYRENLRRFVAGEPLLSVVDPARGY